MAAGRFFLRFNRQGADGAPRDGRPFRQSVVEKTRGLRRPSAPNRRAGNGGLQQRIHLSVRLLDGTVGINDGVCAADLFIRRHLRINAALGLLAAQPVALEKAPVRVDGSSMLNTLEDSEFMIATKFDYLMGDPERFDIVICDYPNTDDGMYRVKRVIGLPGETILLRKGELYVNGEHIEQQFDMTPNETDFGPLTVPEGKYFVMGDNRNNSKDSRQVGALERKMIKGHVRCVVFPLNKARILGE